MSKKNQYLSIENKKQIKFSYIKQPDRSTKTLDIANSEENTSLNENENNINPPRYTDITKIAPTKVKKFKKLNNFPNQTKEVKAEKKVQHKNINSAPKLTNVEQENIKPDISIQENMPKPQVVEISDLIGEKCELDLEILQIPFNNFDQSKISSKSMGVIRSYGANTYQGLVRNYNEDRVSIIINMNKPLSYKNYWPKTSLFGIYDGHGGAKCADFLRDYLHKYIFNDPNYPDNICEAIKNGFLKAENEFLNNYAIDKNNSMNILDHSGSCAVVIIIVDNKIFIANVGDSRCVLSLNNGEKYVVVTEDHKPSNENEKNRIIQNGGQVYQTQTPITDAENESLNGQILLGPYRVIPGRLSVSRTIGDIEAKGIQFGGNPNVIIPYPEIYCYDLDKDDIDFIILGCDGIYDQISSEEILDCAWMILRNNDINLNLHEKCGMIVDFILKASMARKSFDNITCVMISLKDEFGTKGNSNEKILTKINKNFVETHTNIVPKSAINSITNATPIMNSITNVQKKKIKAFTIDTERVKKIKNFRGIKNSNNNTNKSVEKSNKTKPKISLNQKSHKVQNLNKNNINNIKKILNKSDIFHSDYQKIDTERTYSRKTFIKKMTKNKLADSKKDLEYIHNHIHSNKNFLNKNKFNGNFYNRKTNNVSSNFSNSQKNAMITINNINSINNLKDKNYSIKTKRNDISCDTINKNMQKNKFKFIDMKKSENRNKMKMKLDSNNNNNNNNSAIHSYRANFPNKNEFNINSKKNFQHLPNFPDKMRQSHSSRRNQQYNQIILNNLNFHFNIQKMNKNNNKEKLIKTQRVIDRSANGIGSGNDLEFFLKKNLKNLGIRKNKDLKLDINNNNISNKNNAKRVKTGIKYNNSVENQNILDSSKNHFVTNKFQNIIHKGNNPNYISSTFTNYIANNKLISH